MTRVSRANWLRALAAVFLLAAAVKLMRPYVIPLPLDRCRSRQFDPSMWRDSTRVASEEAVRGCMVDELLVRNDLTGWSRDSVLSVLGPPTATDYFRDFDLVYWLGPERGFISIDSEWLVLKLDSRGRVFRAQVLTD